ncbi:MAG: hypothetical protein L6R00_21505, partial [Phycisphaerae bacterium]|nr:hypothetical protein [Phycisphaerae bacterium]
MHVKEKYSGVGQVMPNDPTRGRLFFVALAFAGGLGPEENMGREFAIQQFQRSRQLRRVGTSRFVFPVPVELLLK